MGRSRSLSIPKDLQVEFPHLWFLNKTLHKFSKGKPFPPHIDAVQVFKNFFRSNVLTETTNAGKMRHRAVAYATEAMKDLYDRSSMHHRWDTAKPMDEMGCFAKFHYFLNPSSLLAAVCVFGGDVIPPAWHDYWDLFGWMLQDPATWPNSMPEFWRGSHFDQERWIAKHFQPERSSTSGVPPEIVAQDVNEWFHGPGVMPSNWGDVRVDDPRFPYDWGSYLNDKDKKIRPPKWIRDAVAAGAGLHGFIIPDEEELESGMNSEEEDDTEVDLKDDEGTILEIPKRVSRRRTAYQESRLPREDSVESVAARWESQSRMFTRSMRRRQLRLDEQPDTISQECQREEETDLNCALWEVQYDDAVEQLEKIRKSCPETCAISTARPQHIVKADVESLESLSALMKTRAIIFSSSLKQKEKTMSELQQVCDETRTSLSQAKRLLDDSKSMIARLRSEIDVRNMLEESERARKRQRLSATAGNTLAHISVEDQRASHQREQGEDLNTNNANMSDIDILRAAYARHYQTTENVGAWKYYKRAIAKFMPYWCAFGKETWQGGFSHFKAELERVVNFKLPKHDALREIYEVEFEAREEMECWDPLYDKMLPVFQPEHVFGHE